MGTPSFFELMRCLAFQYLLWMCQTHLVAQTHLLQYRTLTPADGLAGSTVYSIVQDNEGFIWFSTAEGIQQYDGYRFRTYTPATHNLRAHTYQRILYVCGRIWAIRWHPGYLIDILDPATRQIQSFESVFPHAPFALQDISRFSVGPRQTIVFETKTGEVFQFDGQFRRLGSKGKVFKGANICFPNDSTVWLICDRRWYEMHAGSGDILRSDTIELPCEMVTENLKDGIFMLASKDFRGLKRLWFKKLGQTPRAEYPSSDSAAIDLSSYYVIGIDRSERLWLFKSGTIDVIESGSGRKVAVLNLRDIMEKTGHAIDYASFSRVYFDLNNLAWIPTGRGILIVSVVENNLQLFLEGQGISVREMIALDQKRVIAATYKGLKLLDLRQPNASTDMPGLQYTPVRLLYEAPYLWVTTHEYNLLRYDMKQRQTRQYLFPRQDDRKVYNAGLACYRDTEKRLWVGTEKGLLWLDERQDTLLEWTPLRAGIGGSGDIMVDVRHFLENKEGLWLATSKGLFLKPASIDSVETVGVFSKENIYHLYIDGDGIFWMATRGSGVIRWDRQKKNVTRFTTAQGLSNNTVYSIYEDKNGHLWMSTNVGMNVLDKKNFSIQVFTTRDGLTNNEFNFASHLRMPDGRLLFGGLDGVVAFYPEQMKINRNQNTPLLIWNIQRLAPATGRVKDLLTEFQDKGKIHIPQSENNLYIEFALLDLFDPAANRYAYLLEGISPEWQYIRESYLRLNSLPYGTYQLRIRGIGSDGVQSTRELVIPLVVETPFYMHPVFWMLAILGTAGLVRVRTWQLRLAKRRLEYQVAERTAHIEAQNAELEKLNRTKDQIFAILGHELRGPVMQLQDFSEKVDYLVKKGETERLKTLSDHFGQTIANVREVLENLLSWGKIQSGLQIHRPQHFELQQVTNEIFRQTSQLAELKNIHFKIGEQAPLYLFADPHAVGIVIRNVLHNAMKFTPRGGAVAFFAKQTSETMATLEVADSGIGMDETLLSQINAGRSIESRSGTGGERGTGLGLSVCRDLVTKNGGQLDMISKPGQGTTVRITFPIQPSSSTHP